MSGVVRMPHVDRDPLRPGMSMMPYAPLSLRLGDLVVVEHALQVQLGALPPARLAFAWAKSDAAPVLLGQVNFFLEFDVCFHRKLGYFEVRARG